MFVDPLTAFATIKSAHSVIMQGVKIGKDLHKLTGFISKFANAEAQLEHHSSKKGKSILGKFSSVEQTAIEAHLRKEEVRRMKDELKDVILIHGSPGQWERLQAEIAHVKKEHKLRIRKVEAMKKKARDRIIYIVAIVVVIAFLYYEYQIIKDML